MASLLRQIVAGPRARHPEADLDLCYVTDRIIATSGPSQTYPQRAYRNPLDRVVNFLDSKHGEDWAIWEFRAEGTGYPDEAVYGRVRHYPWPDHHPPPFRLMPLIMASMRNWLHGGELHDAPSSTSDENGAGTTNTAANTTSTVDSETIEKRKKNRVVVVHCKAGKGRSGTVSCSYLISEEGWDPEDALARFTQRRMRPQFGAGVSIPSQLRWVSYIDRWTKGGKRYIDRPIEIVEIHVWGLCNGVKVEVQGFAQEGKQIKVFHTFKKEERMVVEGDAPEGLGLSDMMWELAGYGVKPNKAPEEADLADGANANNTSSGGDHEGKDKTDPEKKDSLKKRGTVLINMVSATGARKVEKIKSKTFADHGATKGAPEDTSRSSSPSSEEEPGGMAVILKPEQPIVIPHSDVNISVERRNRTKKSFGMTMVTAVGHVWFNAFFEGKGPEQENKPKDSGVFSIDWDAMDGIKGTSRKGARALDRMAVVWRVAGTGEGAEINSIGEEVDEPEEGKPVPQTQAADWKGGDATTTVPEKTLGLRVQSPDSADISRASSVRSLDAVIGSGSTAPLGKDAKKDDSLVGGNDNDQESLVGVKRSGPFGEKWPDDEPTSATSTAGTGDVSHAPIRQDEPVASKPATTAEDVLENPDRADGTTKAGTTEIVESKK